MIGRNEEDRLKRELVVLFGHINNMRRELAALQAPASGAGDFASMADTLDAIVEQTEVAGNTILESMEGLDGIVTEIREGADPKTADLCDQASRHVSTVFEACSFQDLTGQRITKVVNSLKFVEARVNAMIRLWGKDELAEAVAEITSEAQPVDPDKALLHGPQRAAVAISQDDVDKLFSQDDIDKLFD